jgi:hypothetical protein
MGVSQYHPAGRGRPEGERRSRGHSAHQRIHITASVFINDDEQGLHADFKLADPGSPTLIADKDEKAALYVLMPMRV